MTPSWKLGQLRIRYLNTIVCELEGLPKRTAGRILHERRPDLFYSINAARVFLQSLTNSNGGRPPVQFQSPFMNKDKSTIQEGLAKLRAYQAKQEPQIVLNDCEILILSDIHLPFHDQESLSVAIDYGMERQPDVVLLNGDILDCYDISRFNKEQDRPSIVDELQMGKEFLTLLRQAFPDARIIYKLGNHEERLRNYILNNAPEFGNLAALELHVLLGFEELKIERVDRAIVKAGKLNILHGHEMGEAIFSPVNPARGFFLKAKANTLVGHYHQSSHHSEAISMVIRWEYGLPAVSAHCLRSIGPMHSPSGSMGSLM